MKGVGIPLEERSGGDAGDVTHTRYLKKCSTGCLKTTMYRKGAVPLVFSCGPARHLLIKVSSSPREYIFMIRCENGPLNPSNSAWRRRQHALVRVGVAWSPSCLSFDRSQPRKSRVGSSLYWGAEAGGFVLLRLASCAFPVVFPTVDGALLPSTLWTLRGSQRKAQASSNRLCEA